MNRNTIFAFLLIFLTVWFFSTPTYNKVYYKYILKKPYPEQTIPSVAKQQDTNSIVPTTDSVNKMAEIKAADTVKNDKQKTAGFFATNYTDTTIKADTVWINTNKMIVGIDQKGARIVSVKMKDYKYYTSNKSVPVNEKNDDIELLPKASSGGSQLTVGGKTYDNVKFSSNDSGTVKVGTAKNIIFTSNDGGNSVQKIYTFYKDNYKIDLKIVRNNMINEPVTIGWDAGLIESEQVGSRNSQPESKKIHFSNESEVQHLELKKPENIDPMGGDYKWVGVSSKYFFVALVADSMNDADIGIQSRFVDGVNLADKKQFKEVNYSFQYKTTAKSDTVGFWFYTGPAHYNELKKFNLKFNQIFFPVLGWTKYFFWADKWFPPVAEAILWLLLVLYSFFKDYGIAIIVLTILSRLITYPLTHSSMKSMNRMKDIQPKITAIRNKHKNNPQKMNAEIMALYKEEGINPLNPGCLPLFLQMPVFIALFIVLKKAIELRGASTLLVPWVHDLSQPEVLFSLKSIIPGGIPFYGSNIALLPIVMAILTFVQNKMTIKDPNQKAMIWMMPIIMLVLFNSFPAGLVLYWTFSSALGLVQQYYTNKASEKRLLLREQKVVSPKKK